MSAIWKYPLTPGTCVLEMPRGARLLAVQVQRHIPCVWAMVDPKAPKVKRKIAIVPTGREVAGISPDSYVGMFQLENEELVFHLFDFGEAY